MHQAFGYPASLAELRQYIVHHSDVYFYGIAMKVDRALTDPDLKESNSEHMESWRRACSLRLVGSELGSIPRMIDTLLMERLLIEHAFALSAFRFDSVEELAGSALP